MDKINTRQYFDETGSVKYNQVLLPQHLVTEVLKSLNRKANKPPVISKMLIETQQKYYYHGIAKLVRKWVQGCVTCIRDKRIPNSSIMPELPNLPNGTSVQRTRCKMTCYRTYPQAVDMKTSSPQWTFLQDIFSLTQSLTPRSQIRQGLYLIS